MRSSLYITCFSPFTILIHYTIYVSIWLFYFVPWILKRVRFLRIICAAAFRRYIGNLGGIGTPGVSSSSFAPKDLHKEVTPEKVNLFVNFQLFVFSC